MTTCPSCQSGNADGARFCNQCGAELAAPRPVEGERKLATVLFADVVRSTAHAERLDPEDWAAVMNGAFAFMNAAVDRFGGTVTRLMGDAVLALFGAPVALEDHAERAVRSGLALIEASRDYAATIADRHGIEFEVRVGINTGTSVLGLVGDQVRAEYTSMGDTANVAARLQSAAAPGTVLISGSTRRLVEGVFDLEDGGVLPLKGKADAVRSWRVVAARAGGGRTRGIEGLRAPLVGRESEVERLRERVAALDSGAGGVVAVVGEAGLGKSRLLAELRDEVATFRPDIGWFEGRAISYGHALPYHPWQQLGRAMIGAEPGDSPPAVRARLAAFCDTLGIRAGHRPLLETMLAVETAETRAALAGLEGEGLAEQIGDAVAASIRGSIDAAGRHGHVLVFDDLHWSDTASLDLVAHVASMALSEPLLLVCLLRPDRKAPSWALLDRLRGSTGSAYLELDLAPLDARRSRELLGELLHVEDLPDSVRALILEKSDGNPFFIEEVLRSLIDSGHVVRDNGHWRATREIVDVTIPDTLTAVLSARIDRLPETTKRVAQTAAVIGRSFGYRALTTVCRTAPDPERIENVDPHIGTLTYEELVRESLRDADRDADRPPDREYMFKHALTQEAAYGLLLKKRRRTLHLRVAAVLEEVFHDRLDELIAELAHHYFEGGDGVRAARYAVTGAERATRLDALAEANEHYRRAYEALDGVAEPPADLMIDVVLAWTAVLYKMKRYDGLEDRLRRAETLARAADDRERLARTLSWIGLVHMITGFPARAGPYLEESSALASELGMTHLILLPLFFATEQLIDTDPGKAVEQFEEVVRMARELRMPEVEGHALASSAMALARMGEFDRARERIAVALASAPSGGHKVKEADVHLLVAAAYYELGELDLGLEHARLGTVMSEETGALECACAGHFFVGLVELERRETERARASFDQSLEVGDRAGWTGWTGFRNRILAGGALAELEDGSDEAVARLEAALANARSGHDEYIAGMIAETLARALLERGRTAPAGAHLQAALDYYRGAGMKPYLARALRVAAAIAEREGRAADAEAARAESDALTTRPTGAAPDAVSAS